MPGEAFIPTPYGADSRFRPKTIWVYLDEYQAPNTSRPKRTNAWVIASSGDLVYSGAKIFSSPIDLPIRKATKNSKFALTAALTGKVEGVDYDAAIKLANDENVELQIDLGETEIEYVNYFDMLMAQNQNSSKLDQLNSLLKQRHGKDIPTRRVITAALKVNGAKIKAKSKNGNTISAKLSVILGSLGFEYNKESNEFDALEVNGLRYIGYAARYTNEFGLISTGADPDFDDDQKSNIPVDENSEWWLSN